MLQYFALFRFYFLLFFCMTFSVFSLAEDLLDGQEGYFWYNVADPQFMGSYSAEAARSSFSHSDSPLYGYEDVVYVMTYMAADDGDPNTEEQPIVIYNPVINGVLDQTKQIGVARESCYSDTPLGQWGLGQTSCQSGYVQGVSDNPQICSDGFPPDVYGYTDYCDRPTPKQCTDGSYVESTSICSVSDSPCSDYDTCYQYAQNQANCYSYDSSFTFNYQNPNSFDSVCVSIDPSSPDHPDNGGNADSNLYNDPSSPDAPITSGDSDPSALAAAIGLELRSDFGNVERAIRDSITSDNSNTDRTIESINLAQSNLNSTLTDIKLALREGNSLGDGSSSIVDSVNGASSNISDAIGQSSSNISDAFNNGSNDVVNSIENLNQSVVLGNSARSGQLSDISSKLDDLTPCDSLTDPNSCEGEHGLTSSFITNVMGTLNSVFDNENAAAVDALKGEIADIESVSPLDSSIVEGIFDPILNIFPQPQECIPLSFGNSSQPYYFTLSCDFSDKFKAVFGFLLAFYTIQQLIGIIISSTQPRQEGV